MDVQPGSSAPGKGLMLGKKWIVRSRCSVGDYRLSVSRPHIHEVVEGEMIDGRVGQHQIAR